MSSPRDGAWFPLSSSLSKYSCWSRRRRHWSRWTRRSCPYFGHRKRTPHPRLVAGGGGQGGLPLPSRPNHHQHAPCRTFDCRHGGEVEQRRAEVERPSYPRSCHRWSYGTWRRSRRRSFERRRVGLGRRQQGWRDCLCYRCLGADGRKQDVPAGRGQGSRARRRGGQAEGSGARRGQQGLRGGREARSRRLREGCLHLVRHIGAQGSWTQQGG